MSLFSLTVDVVLKNDCISIGLFSDEIQTRLLARALELGLVDRVAEANEASSLSILSPTFSGFRHLRQFCNLSCVVIRANIDSDSVDTLLANCGHVLKKLELQSGLLTDSAFRGLSGRVTALELLVLDGCKRLSIATVQEALACSQLGCFSCGDFVGLLTDPLIAAIEGAQCSFLQELGFACAKGLTKDVLSAIARKFAFLRRLLVKFCFSLVSLDPLCHLGHLEHLDISGCPKVSLPLKQLVHLRSFKAEFCDSLTDLSPLPKNITFLDVGSLKRLVPEPALNLVSKFAFLQRIRMQMTDTFFRDPFLVDLVAACGASLQEIQLSPCLIGTDGMIAVSQCAGLEICHLPGTWCEATDESLSQVATRCKSLRSLSLGKQERAADAAFMSMSSLECLELLDLSVHSLSSHALKQSNLPPTLKCLSLRYCRRVEGSSLMALTKLPLLQALDISHTSLGFEDLLTFVSRSTSPLSFLNATGLPISVLQQRKFAEAFPKIQLFV